MTEPGAEKAHEGIRLFQQLSGNRGTWESHWDEIARRIMPAAAGRFYLNENRTKGDKRTEELYDSTASIALGRFAAILDSLLTPRNQTWHRLVSNNKDLNKDRQVRLWFEEVNRLLFKYRYTPKANFSSQNQSNYKSLGAFGSGCMFIDDMALESGIRYKNCHLGEVYFLENHQGIIDGVVRHFTMQVRQAKQKWGDNLPASLLSAADRNPQTEFKFLHIVKPRQEVDVERLDYKGMPFESIYISIEGQKLLEEDGYWTFPYAPSRYEQWPNETYGRGPAMDVLPAIKTLNEQKKTVLKQGHRTVDPIILLHDDGVLDTFSLKPGSVHAGGVSKEGRPLVHTLPIGNVNIGKDLMDDERAVINDSFLVTIFQILVDTPQMTATEVMERTREKGILLAPTIGRQQSEYLGPMIEREIDVLFRQGILPQMPPALLEAQGDYKIEYDSPLSRIQRAEEASGFMRTLETILGVVNVTQDPAPLDHFDMDVIVPDLGDINAMPVRWRKSIEQVTQIRQGRAQQQQQQQMAEAAPGAAALMNANSKAQGK